MMLRWEIVFMRSPLTQYDELLNVVYEASGATTDERVLRPAQQPQRWKYDENQCRGDDEFESLALAEIC